MQIEGTVRSFWLFLLGSQICAISSMLAKSKGAVHSGFSPPDFSKILTAESLTECQLMCEYDKQCMSYFFHRSKQQCTLEPISYIDDTLLRVEAGWTFMQWEHEDCPSSYLYNREFKVCYKAYNEKMMMNVTRFKEICADDNADLLRIKSKKFNDNIVQFLRSQTDKVASFAIQGQWNGSKWIFDDGTVLTYFNWTGEFDKKIPVSSNIYMRSKFNKLSFRWVKNKPVQRHLSSGVICGKSTNS